jgi:hypothetical protein
VLPYLGFGSINMGETGENAHYNGMQFSVRSQLGKDLTLQGAYTLSRAIDPAESFGGDNTGVFNPYDRGYDYGPSQVDATHIGVLSFVYDLPVFRNTGSHLTKAALGGWQLAGIWTVQSGFPLLITLGGSQGANGTALGVNRPDFNGTISYLNSPNQWFTTNGFSIPEVGAWGNLRKGEIRGPGRNNWNISMHKSFLISEARGSHFELRFESFNTLNHTQFQNINTQFTGFNADGTAKGDFGKPSSTWEPRTFQLGAKLIF